jgi:NAD(P)H-hydrate epimerase
MKLVSVQQMRDLEKEADQKGLSYSEMMQHAGAGVAEVIMSRYAGSKGSMLVVGLAGPGNNGGDTIVALTNMQRAGWNTRGVCFFRKQEPDPLVDAYLQSGGVILLYTENQPIFDRMDASCILLDGLLGTGTQLPLKPKMAELLASIQSQLRDQDQAPDVIAVDCPSGIDCDSGETPDVVLDADLTICMGAVKKGLLEPQALQKCGELVAVPIGLDQAVPGWDANLAGEVASDDLIREYLPERKADGHKGTYGTAFIVGGMVEYTGAPLLAGRGAYVAGAGLVRVAVPESLHPILAGQLPEATWILLPQVRGSIAEEAAGVIHRKLDQADSLLVGPGLGLDPSVKKFMARLFSPSNSRKEGSVGFLQSVENEVVEKTRFPRLVVDADGLKCLAEMKEWWKLLPEMSVLTPHPGEMSVLNGLPVAEIQANRVETALQSAKKWNHVVVLKGAETVVAAPDGRYCIIPITTSALAHAGTGDVLAGMIASLLAQGMEPYRAAVCAAYLHGRAGQVAAELVGSPASVLAGDVVGAIGPVLGEFWQ